MKWDGFEKPGAVTPPPNGFANRPADPSHVPVYRRDGGIFLEDIPLAKQ